MMHTFCPLSMGEVGFSRASSTYPRTANPRKAYRSAIREGRGLRGGFSSETLRENLRAKLDGIYHLVYTFL